MSAAVWLARRVAGAVVVWLLISFIAFSLGSLAPGDPAQIILERGSGEPPSTLQVEELRHRLGLDQPFATRYAHWLWNASHGELGTSYRTEQPVLSELRSHFPATLGLALAALAAGLLIAIPLAVVSAAARGTTFDHAARFVALAGVSVPSYWIGYLLILIFAATLRLLPVSGAGDLRHLVLPALTLGLGSAASVARMLRASLLDELGADYVRTARAKGRSPLFALIGHALRNALNPVVTVSALRFGRLLGEAVIVETVFAWPGIGQWMVASIFDRDYPAIQGFVLYIATVFILVNIAVDFSYRFLDPRVRLGAAATRAT